MDEEIVAEMKELKKEKIMQEMHTIESRLHYLHDRIKLINEKLVYLNEGKATLADSNQAMESACQKLNKKLLSLRESIPDFNMEIYEEYKKYFNSKRDAILPNLGIEAHEQYRLYFDYEKQFEMVEAHRKNTIESKNKIEIDINVNEEEKKILQNQIDKATDSLKKYKLKAERVQKWN